MAASNPVRTRRRGAELEDALYAATLAEMTEVGYGRLTIEGIAARARTGKAALYRRWSGKQALVLDALRHTMPSPPELNPHGGARENLLILFSALCEVMSGHTDFPALAIFGEFLREPGLRTVLADETVSPRVELIESVLRRGEQTGEIAAGSLTPLAALVGPALIMQVLLLTGKPPTRRDLNRIIDTVLGVPRQ